MCLGSGKVASYWMFCLGRQPCGVHLLVESDAGIWGYHFCCWCPMLVGVVEGRCSFRWLWNQLGPVLLLLHPDACFAGVGGGVFCCYAQQPKMVLLVSEQEHSAVVPCRAISNMGCAAAVGEFGALLLLPCDYAALPLLGIWIDSDFVCCKLSQILLVRCEDGVGAL
ncbi:hypothetical protein Nepgr_023116 [Nepenthes gracilis]|uniref:Uncharacterized protein n=1 Tax=Nepenthes gracilis TaxID=150966 RepID=A0AAD3T2B4_NEPGR|nr:hypothetical protein Nepgr_023116 [Nepenthes gracilis]